MRSTTLCKHLQPLRSLAGFAAVLLGISAPAHGQSFSGTYNLAGDGNNVSTFAYNGTPISGLTPSALDKVGITSSSSTGNFRGSNWPIGTVDVDGADTAKYIEFTLTAAPGFLINNPGITFGVGRSGTGPRQWQWRSSADSFASPIPVTTVNAGLTHNAGVLTSPDDTTGRTGNVIETSGAPYLGLTTVTFRLYGYNSEASGGTGGLQGNLTFSGTLVSDGSDETSPTLFSLSPGNNATGIALDSTITITLNEPIQAGSGNVVLYQGATLVETFAANTAVFDGASATFTPASAFSNSTSYHVIVEATAFEDLAGNPFAGLPLETDWAFTTIGADVTGPVAATLVPANNSTAIPLNLTEIRVSFDEPVTLETGTIELRKVDGDALVFSVAVDDPFGVFVGEPEELIIPLDESILEYSTQYYVSFPAGAVTDSLANPSLAFGPPASASPWVFTTQAAPVPPTVVVNKYANVGGGTLDLIELLVIGTEVPGSTVDMRGMIVKDFSSSMANDGGAKYQFADDVFWSAVPVGTLIVLNGGITTADTDASDFTLAVGLGDTLRFTKVGTETFDIAGTEMIMIKSAGSATAGVEGGIHALAAGAAGAQFNAFLGTKLIATSTTGTNTGVIANNTTSNLADFNGTDATGAVPLANMPFGSPNNSTNGVYINELRGLNAGDGAGLAQLTNATPASPFAGSRVFGRGLAAQSVAINVSLDLPAVTVTDVAIDVPADFGVPVFGSITLSGPASTGAGVSVTGQTITITDAAVTETDSLTVTIAGLNTPATLASGDFGVRVFPVSTATSGGTLTGVSIDPAASVIVPISNLREVNANAVPLALGAVVAVEGVATVANLSATNTQSAIQDATAGIGLFDAETTSPFVRGNRYVVYGPVAQFNGLSQINYGGTANVFDLGADVEPPAQEVTIPALLAAAENLEGSLVTVKNLSYVSGTWAAAQNVTLQDADLNTIVIRIQAGSTAITEPTYPVTITGILGQFDSNSPFTAGYQLMPRVMADLAPGDEPPADDFAAWIAGFDVGMLTGPFDIPMGDGVPNVLKHILGLAADVPVTGALVEATASAPGSLTFEHTRIKPADLGSDVVAGYEWSTDLATWTADGGSSGGVTVVFGAPVVLDATNPDYDVVSVTATVTEGSAARVFVRLAGGVVPPI